MRERVSVHVCVLFLFRSTTDFVSRCGENKLKNKYRSILVCVPSRDEPVTLKAAEIRVNVRASRPHRK